MSLTWINSIRLIKVLQHFSIIFSLSTGLIESKSTFKIQQQPLFSSHRASDDRKSSCRVQQRPETWTAGASKFIKYLISLFGIFHGKSGRNFKNKKKPSPIVHQHNFWLEIPQPENGVSPNFPPPHSPFRLRKRPKVFPPFSDTDLGTRIFGDFVKKARGGRLSFSEKDKPSHATDRFTHGPLLTLREAYFRWHTSTTRRGIAGARSFHISGDPRISFQSSLLRLI